MPKSQQTEMNGFWLNFLSYLLLGNASVGRNRITEGYDGCHPNNSSPGGNHWQFWKAENKGYKGNRVDAKVQNMFSNLCFKFMKKLNYSDFLNFLITVAIQCYLTLFQVYSIVVRHLYNLKSNPPSDTMYSYYNIIDYIP